MNIITSEEARPWKFISQAVYLNKERIDLEEAIDKLRNGTH